jgi:geranylgeranyl pyrophosphate synthase
LACEACGGESKQALDAAVACEMIHAYSLVHDDLPCMDDDNLRRGKKTVHVAFGEAEAVLVGDALQATAFEILASQKDPDKAKKMLYHLARASGPSGMVGGQILDMEAEEKELSVEQVSAIHRAKTGALLEASLCLGAIAGNGNPEHWKEFGWCLGALFQATDDVLDATQSTEDLGKTAGKDAEAKKATLVSSCGLDGAHALVEQWAARAEAALESLSLTLHKDILLDLPRFLRDRCR